MKSRYFSIPGLLVDVSEIVAIEYANANEPRIIFRNSPTVYTDIATAKCIHEYTEEYEAATQARWQGVTA